LKIINWKLIIMSFPLIIFLYIYFAFLAVWLIFSAIGIYHLLRYGFLNFMTFFSLLGYAAISFLILAVSYDYIREIDWNVAISIFDGAFSANSYFNIK
jgi:hypothetical protein